MLWFNHPSYMRAREEVRRRLRVRRSRFKNLRPIIFFCGGNKSQRRERLNEYLGKFGNWLTFYAEDVFQVLTAAEPNANALQLENDVAELADAIIVIAESPGTFAELGAFALSNDLRTKLLPIADIEYKNEESFLKVGPIRWVDKDSLFGPTIWADFSVILTVAAEVEKRLKARIHDRTTKDIRQIIIKQSRRHLLFMVVLIVEILGPTSGTEIREFLEGIIDARSSGNFMTFLALAKSLRLVKSIEFEGEDLYFSSKRGFNVGEIRKLTPLTVAGLRAQILSAMQNIPSAIKALELLARLPSSVA